MFEVKGVVPPLITPMDENEKLDEAGLRRLLNYVIDGGVHGVFVIGSTGEFYGLDFEAKKRIVEITMEEVNGRVPVFVGASAITTRECIRLAELAKANEADAISVLTPMFIDPNERELFDHFSAIAHAVDIPNILYNNPDRTGINMSAGLVERLADIANIVGVKDTSGDMTLTSEYIRRTLGKKGFGVMAGKDTMIFPTLCCGGKGCVAGTANVLPKLVVEIYDKFMAGDMLGARDAQFKLSLFRNAYSLGSFPVVPKDALNMLGVNVGHPIRPIQHMTEENQAKLRQILMEIGAFDK
jgi:4-hydroxy-tetrahydrodipicolinate synthase